MPVDTDLAGPDDRIRFSEVGWALRLAVSSMRAETAEMDSMLRRIFWLSVVCFCGVVLQAVIALPLAILLFGWGYSV